MGGSPAGGGVRVRSRYDDLVLERHAQDPLAAVDPYLVDPVGREPGSDDEGVVGGSLHGSEVSDLFCVEEVHYGTDRDGRVGVRGQFFRQLLGDLRELFGDLAFSGKFRLQVFQVRMIYRKLLLFLAVLLRVPAQVPPPDHVFDDQDGGEKDKRGLGGYECVGVHYRSLSANPRALFNEILSDPAPPHALVYDVMRPFSSRSPPAPSGWPPLPGRRAGSPTFRTPGEPR